MRIDCSIREQNKKEKRGLHSFNAWCLIDLENTKSGRVAGRHLLFFCLSDFGFFKMTFRILWCSSGYLKNLLIPFQYFILFTSKNRRLNSSIYYPSWCDRTKQSRKLKILDHLRWERLDVGCWSAVVTKEIVAIGIPFERVASGSRWRRSMYNRIVSVATWNYSSGRCPIRSRFFSFIGCVVQIYIVVVAISFLTGRLHHRRHQTFNNGTITKKETRFDTNKKK